MGYTYHTCCVNSTAELIGEMVDNAIEISYRTFIKHVPIEEIKELFPYYDFHGKGGLNLKHDWAVSFHRSKYRGRRCYYMRHSSIEYIWIE